MSVADNSADPERAINPKYMIALGICVLALATYLAVIYFGGPESPGALAARILAASDAATRKQAALELASVVDRSAALPHLRRVANESKDPEVLAIVLPRLLSLRDSESLPLCFAALNHASKEVRLSDYRGLEAYYGNGLPEGLEYSVDAPTESRALVVAKLIEMNAAASSAMMPPGSPSAMTSRPAGTAKKDETSSPSPTPPSQSESPLPSHGASQFPAPAASAENQAVNVLAWMFRGLAVMVLLAEIAGAISLVVRERPAKNSRAANKQLSAAEEFEKILDKKSTGLWNKVALLAAGAIVAVALLMGAEMSQLAVQMTQATLRLEHKIDNLPQSR